MKRVLFAAFICAVLFAALYRPAFALAEFCPASVRIQPVASADTWQIGDSSAALYGFELSALGSRTASGVIAFDTDSGWYTADVPFVGQRDFVSPRMYVRFPSAVTVMNAWMYHAQAVDDGKFGWQAKGEIQCAPPPRARKQHEPVVSEDDPARMYPKDGDHLSAAPTDREIIVDAKPSPAIFHANCTDPNDDASVAVAVAPDWSLGYSPPKASSAVWVAVNADGTLVDAWISQPSGVREVDEAALKAAMKSTYEPARAYCRPVPGVYLFRVSFDPR